ncbi:MAG: sensor histidine kinase [Longimicrobiales bacterium]
MSMDLRSRPWLAPVHRWAWLVTLVTIALLELVSNSRLYLSDPGVILILAIGLAAFREGILSGLLNAALAIGYILHFALAHRGSSFSAADLRNDVVIAVLLLMAALLAGGLRNRLKRVIEQERELRDVADRERERSARILDTMTDGFITITRDWRITFANRRAEQILNVTRERMVGANALALFHPARGSSIHKTLAHAFETGVPVEVEDYFALTDRWFEIRVYPAGNDYTVYFRDITARRRAQASIRFQTRLLDAIAQAVLAADPDGTIIYWNRAAERVFGWTAEEVVGRARIRMTHAGQSEAEESKLLARLRTGKPWLGEGLMLSKNGTTFSAALADAPITAEDGSPMGVVRIVTDLTTRKTIEEEHRFLAVASAALAATLDVESTIRTVARLAVPTLADGCVVDLVDEDGAIRRLEAAHVDARKENLIREIMRRYPNAPAANPGVLEVIRTGQSKLVPHVSDQFRSALALDSRHLALLDEIGLRSALFVPLVAHGRILGALSMVSTEADRVFTSNDLRTAEELANRAAVAIENARLYEAAVVASRAKSDFLAVMSHELRTPLTTVMGYTDLLLAGVPRPLDDKALVYIERIRTAAWHLLGIIEQILIFARLEGGREQLHPQRVEVAALMRDAGGLIEPVAAEKGLGFRVIAPPDVVVETDPTKLRQVLLNLLSNAVKFTEHGEVTLEAVADQRQVTFLVRDTGIGIANEHLHRVFDAFWQVDQSSTRQVGGMGLGLSVARRLTRLLGGEVSVDSVANTGTTFRVELPLRWGQSLGIGTVPILASSGAVSRN